MSWNFDIIKYRNGMWPKSLVDEWQNIAEKGKCSHVFFHPSMVKVWLDTYMPLRNMEPFMIRAVSGDNIALMPMVLWRKNWKSAFQNCIIPVGYSDFDYHDPLFGSVPSIQEQNDFWKGLIRIVDDNYKYDTFTTDGITDSFAVSEHDWSKGEICPRLVLNGLHSEDDLMSFFKTSLRGDIRRQIRRLEEIGSLNLKEYQSFAEVPRETFDCFMEQHTIRWPKAYKAPHFHENLLRYGLESGVVHFSVLCAGEQELAWHLGFSYRGQYYYYMPAANHSFLKYSPTKIHLFFLVRRAIEVGYEVYDHLRGEETYKSGWSNASQHVNVLALESTSALSELKRNLLNIKMLITPPIAISIRFTAA